MNDPEIPNYPLLRDIAASESLRKQRVISYLEIGVCDGGSAEAVLNSGNVHLAVLIDPWGKDYGGAGRGSPDFVAERLKRFANRVVILTGKSQDYLPKMTAQFDMIYVDGDHSLLGAGIDLNESLRFLAPDGVLLLDDVDNVSHPYLRELAVSFANQKNLQLKFHAVHTGMAEMKRK